MIAERHRLPFLGPRPSEALRWEPVVLAAAAIFGALRVVYLELNLFQLRLLQDLHNRFSVSTRRAYVDNAHRLGAASFVLLVSWIALIPGVYWGHLRRPRAIAARKGEYFVGTPYRMISNTLCWAFWGVIAALMLIPAVPVAQVGASYHHLVAAARFRSTSERRERPVATVVPSLPEVWDSGEGRRMAL